MHVLSTHTFSGLAGGADCWGAGFTVGVGVAALAVPFTAAAGVVAVIPLKRTIS